MLGLALKDAAILPQEGAELIEGTALEELIRQYLLADQIIHRQGRWFDSEALSAIAEGVKIDLSSEEQAQAAAKQLEEVLVDPAHPHEVRVFAQLNEESEQWEVIVQRLLHGNIRVSTFDNSFILSPDYNTLEQAGETLMGLIGEGAKVYRGQGERRKEKAIGHFRDAVQWLRQEAERGLVKQRYKGLGEMNPEQLWETTMDPSARRLLQVKIEDAIAADEVFTTLMGDEVEPRRAFIEEHALQAGNLDV